MRHDAIRNVPYDATWPDLFEVERTPVEEALRPVLVGPVQHIGSTAVAGLDAKPIIDMLAVVRDIDQVDRPAVVACGWILAPEPADDQERRLSFCKPSVERRTHHMHVVEDRFDPWHDWVVFRDYLRRHPETTLRYARLKRDLAAADGSDPDDRSAYRAGKSAFIAGVVEAARTGGG